MQVNIETTLIEFLKRHSFSEFKRQIQSQSKNNNYIEKIKEIILLEEIIGMPDSGTILFFDEKLVYNNFSKNILFSAFNYILNDS
jgi:hypothetical protein